MAPRRSGRRNVSAYKKDDYIEYQYKGSTVTGKLLRKSRSGSEAKPIWIVTPSDRRRKNEDIPEKALGKIINAEEAMSNRGPKLKKTNRSMSNSSSPTSANSNSDGSLEEAQPKKSKGGRGSSIEDNSNTGASATGKRKSNESNSNSNSDSHRAKTKKARKVVTFSRESNTIATSNKKILRKPKKAKTTSARIGTRSTRGSSEAVLLPELPARRKNLFKTKRVKKDENVKVVKMLTGTLYLYRGDRPRAEFVRCK